jgi:hypothetical protein
MSQLLQRLERELRNEQHGATRRAELSAQRAGYLARVGRFEEARQAVAELRKIYGDGHSGPITVWIMLAETMILLYENLQPAAADRIKRAQFLSELMQDKPLLALTSAWKANLEFEFSHFPDMFASLAIARANAHPSDHTTGARLALVLCKAFFNCGEMQQAQHWFMRCREHALIEGDQASLEALLYNRAAFRMAWLRAQSCFGKVSRDELVRTKNEIATSRNYQEIIQVRSLTDFVDFCDARILVLQEEYAAALPALAAVRSSVQFASRYFDPKLIDLEVAYCHHGLNQPDEALSVFASIGELKLESFDTDEQLRALWMLKQLASVNSQYGDLSDLQKKFEAAASAYTSTIDSLKTGLQNFRIDSSETNTSQPSALN